MDEFETLFALLREYRERGIAVTRVTPGEKVPTFPRWTLAGLEEYDFRRGDQVGILCGRLSGDLVCVDLDSPQANESADRFLPPTAMSDGRPSKPRSHRFYRVANIPSELTAGPLVAGGVGGPRIRHFQDAGIDLIGTGGQVVAPPSVHPSGEFRAWHEFGEPALVDCAALYAAVERLAVECGYRPRERAPAASPASPRPRPTGPASDEPVFVDGLPDVEERAARARAYLAALPGAVSGRGGHARTFQAACLLVRDFALPTGIAWELLAEYNRRCSPPWSGAELEHKLADADRYDGSRGRRLLLPGRLGGVPEQPPDVYVAVDTEFEGPRTLTVQAAAFIDPDTVAVQVYRAGSVPPPGPDFDLGAYLPAGPSAFGRFFGRAVFRPVRTLSEDLSPARVLRDLLGGGPDDWPDLITPCQAAGMARARQAPRSEPLGWGSPAELETRPPLRVTLVGHFLRADLARAFGRDFYRGLATATGRSGGVVMAERPRLQFAGGGRAAPDVEFFSGPGWRRPVRVGTLDTILPFGRGPLHAMGEQFLGAGLGKLDALTEDDKRSMGQAFRRKTGDCYGYAARDAVVTLLVAESMAEQDRKIFRDFNIPDGLTPQMRATQGSRVSVFLMRAAEATVALGASCLPSRSSLEKLVSAGGKSLFEGRTGVSRFGRQTGGTHGGLLFSRSPTRFAHVAPGMLRDVDMAGCYNRITAGMSVYLGRPVILEPGRRVVSLAEAVEFAALHADPDAWLVRASGPIEGFLNTLVPSTEGAVTSANFESARRGGPRRRSRQRVFRQEALRDPSALRDGPGTKLYTGVVESGVVTAATWAVIRALPPAARAAYEGLRADSIVFYPRTHVAEDGPCYDRLMASHRSEGPGWESELDAERMEVVTRERLGAGHVALRFPLADYARRFGELREEARRVHGRKSGAELAWKLHANTVYGVLACGHLPACNFVAANQITAHARAEAFLMTQALNGIQVITDGCTYRIDQVPAVPFAECLRLRPEYPVDRADAGGGVPFLDAATVPQDEAAFTDWYRRHASWFFGDEAGLLAGLLGTHNMEHKKTAKVGTAAFDVLLCDGVANYAKAVSKPGGEVEVVEVSARSYGRAGKDALGPWMAATYVPDRLEALAPVTEDVELLSLKAASRKARRALEAGVPEVIHPLGMAARRVLAYRAIKASAFLFKNPAQRAAVLNQMLRFERETGCGLELLAMRRAYRGRRQGSLEDVAAAIHARIRAGGSNLTVALNLNRLPPALKEVATQRKAEVARRKEAAEEEFRATIDARNLEAEFRVTGMFLTAADVVCVAPTD